MRAFLCITFVCFFVSCTGNSGPQANEFPENGEWVDLSYDFSPETLYWPAEKEGFSLDTVAVGMTGGGYYYAAFSFCAPEHGGTHLDAPVHFAEGKDPVDKLPPEQLIGPAVVINISESALQDRDYQVSVEDLLSWEGANNRIPDNTIALLYTGYGRFYPDAEKYFGTSLKGEEGVANLHFPGLSPEAAIWLVRERNIKAVGIDTPSIDYGQSKDFRTHRELMKENIPAFENVAHLEKLPAKGAYVIALPMKIKGGSGAPLRIIARVPVP
ncbi:cyclase family protein [Negadavirga shengliensis]|uniref:Cyclase family protein n=1 Tax=Negadavirga shengliensis TaxID=1389218 RepID=A0ABV9SVZ2_9BACT